MIERFHSIQRLRIIRLGEILLHGNDEDDDAAIARILNMPAAIIRNLLDEVHRFRHAKVICDSNKIQRENADSTLTSPALFRPLPLHALRSRGLADLHRVSYSRRACSTRPTLLIRDGCRPIVFEGFFDFYSHHFLDPSNHFQTLMCILTRSIDPENILWNGWQFVHTEGKVPDVKLQTGFNPSKSG